MSLHAHRPTNEICAINPVGFDGTKQLTSTLTQSTQRDLKRRLWHATVSAVACRDWPVAKRPFFRPRKAVHRAGSKPDVSTFKCDFWETILLGKTMRNKRRRSERCYRNHAQSQETEKVYKGLNSELHNS